ncbi:MAG: hypothetical protein DUD39_12790 [Coriobacteriaceae bacterium]|nr:MAG: hypothetical protein DUD39_12790 [Coriobacteriaceae bacterium]
MRPKAHFTALFEAQVIVMALSGMTVTAIAHLVHETAHAHMEAAGQGRRRGKGCRRLLGCRAREHRRHRQKAQPKLHQHHGQPRLSACRGRHAGQRQGA